MRQSACSLGSAKARRPFSAAREARPCQQQQQRQMVCAAAKQTQPPPGKPTETAGAASGAAAIPKPLTPPRRPAGSAAPPAAAAGGPAPDVWRKLLEAVNTGEVFEGRIVAVNEGGVVVQLSGGVRGFVPYNQLEPARLKQAPTGDLGYLVGQVVKAKVISVDVKGTRKDVVLSERKVSQTDALRQIKVGATVSGVVTKTEDYGAFIQLDKYPDAFGLVHKSELSWARVMRVEDVLQQGQRVEVMVTAVDLAKLRLTLSLKQMAPDPLKMSIDDLTWLPVADPSGLSAELQQLVALLAAEEGVTAVKATRTAQEPQVAAQEIEVYLGKYDAAGGCGLVVARQGSTLTEFQVAAASLGREKLRDAVQSASSRISREA